MDKAEANLDRILGRNSAQAYRLRINRIRQMPGARRILRRIEQAVKEEQLRDDLNEVQYALILAGAGWEVEFLRESQEERTPDLRITRSGFSTAVEVFRSRETNSRPPETLGRHGELLAYGDSERDSKKVCDRIIEKFPQIRSSETSIMAMWDDGYIEEVGCKQAVRDLRRDALRGCVSIPSSLMCVIYGSEELYHGQQLFCFELQELQNGALTELLATLESCLVNRLVSRALTVPPSQDSTR